jgi:hypothetical protein
MGRESFAILGAIAVGGTAWAHVSMQTDAAPRPGAAPRAHSAPEWGDDRLGAAMRLLSLGWYDSDIWSSLLIVTSRSSRSLRLSRMISLADCNPAVPVHAPTSVCSVTTGPPFRTLGFLFLRRE